MGQRIRKQTYLYADAVNFVSRAAITLVLGLATFLFYCIFAAENILHEPVAGGTCAGTRLGSSIGWCYGPGSTLSASSHGACASWRPLPEAMFRE